MSAPTQLGFEGMPRQLFAGTPAKLASFVDCPRRYRMTYLDRPAPARGGPWAHLSLGAALHLALRSWWLLPEERRVPEAAGSLLASAWISLGFRDDEQERAVRHQAEQWLQTYLADLATVPEPVGVERTVAFRSAALAFSGRADRIDLRDPTQLSVEDDDDGPGVEVTEPQLVVVDYKTGRTASTDDEARGSAALALYALAASRTLRRPCYRVELHHLPTGTVAAHTHTDESLARQLRRAEAVAADITKATDQLRSSGDADASFPANPSRLCGWCDFRAHCPQGQAESNELAPWDGLPS